MKKHRYSCKIIIRDDKIRRDGTCALALQAFINSKRKVIQLGISCKPYEFDKKGQKVRLKNKALSEKYNAILHKAVARANDIFATAILEERVLSRCSFEDAFLDSKPAFDFLAWLQQEIELQKNVVAAGTLKGYRRDYRRLKKWRDNLTFSEIDVACVQSLDKHLKRMKLAPNTIWQVHKFMKKWINVACVQHRGMKNPYEHFKFRPAKTDRVFLSPTELKSLLDHYEKQTLDPLLHRVLRQFLFLCFSSLRIGDARNLQHNNVVEKLLIFQPEKTKQSRMLLRVPLNQVARRLLMNGEGRDGFVFDMYRDNQVFNRYLRKIMDYVGIEKQVTSHVGRHTFATMFLRLGGKIEVLQKIMGHSKIETTQVYVHVLGEDMEEQVNYFDDLFQPKSKRHHSRYSTA